MQKDKTIYNDPAVLEYKKYLQGMFDDINISRHNVLDSLLGIENVENRKMLEEYHFVKVLLERADDVDSLEKASEELDDYIDKYNNRFI